MKKYLLIILSLLIFSSCKKFLDVQPESDATKEQLFSTEEGFKEALNGVYYQCSTLGLYGGNLTFSNLDIMAQNYEFTNSYFNLIASFQYSDNVLIAKSEDIWGNGYKAINNVNQIMDVIDAKKGLFTDKNYELIKGEALTLRAYLHFDMLRMFAPSYRNAPAGKGIPYVTTVGTQSTPFSTVSETLDKIIADLNAAKILLKTSDPILLSSYIIGYPGKAYPIGTPEADKQTETSSRTLFLQNRRHRMNYYTVCGELARVYLYKGDNANSLLYAKEIIDAQKFPWAERADVNNTDVTQRDRIFYPELISAWAVPKSREHTEELFSKLNEADYTSTTTQIDQIYEKANVGADDWRRLQWFQDVAANSTSRSYLIKYNVNATPLNNLHPLVAPTMRLSEIYYIAAEAIFDTDPATAIGYFNLVRSKRGIPATMQAGISKTNFMNELVKECRKEFYGESQIFYMHKRLNRDIISYNGRIYPGSNSIFVFPLPVDEEAYRN